MMLRRLFVVCLLAIGSVGPAAAEPPTFGVGQIWSLSDPAYPNGRVRIGRIEDNGQTVHISLWGIPAPVPEATDVVGSPFVAGHLPITADALRASVRSLVDDQPPALDFEAGYQTWSDARGGVFTITVPQIVDAIFQTIRNGQVSSTN